MRRSFLGPAVTLLIGCAVVAVAAGIDPSDRPVPASQEISLMEPPSGGMAASVDEGFASMPEVWAASEAGDLIPLGPTAAGPAPAVVSSSAPALFTRIPKPLISGPRRVGIQAGHWQTEAAPPELWRLIAQTGTSWNGVNEVDVNLDIAGRIKTVLEARGLAVDLLPTTIPAGYAADAFVALHADGDGSGENSGFKMAHSSRRSPYEQDLLTAIRSSYGAATGLAWDPRITRGMTNYYAMAWQRNKYATAPHTPSVIIEMGYLSNDADRELLTSGADLVANAIADGVVRFLDSHPRDELFGEDLLVPAQPLFRLPTR